MHARARRFVPTLEEEEGEEEEARIVEEEARAKEKEIARTQKVSEWSARALAVTVQFMQVALNAISRSSRLYHFWLYP